MPTSERLQSGSRHGLPVIKALILLVLLVTVNAGLSFLLEPYMGSSEEMWTYYRQMPELDTVYVGTSQCLQGIDPAVVDKETGGHSYNMATNMQSFADSEEAIRCAYRDYGINRAILAIDHEMLGIDRSSNARADQSFWHGKAAAESVRRDGTRVISASSIAASVRDDWSFMTSSAFFGKPASLTYLTPWVYNRTSDLRLNLKEKRERAVLDPSGHRTAQGFQPSDEILDPDWNRITWEEAEEWDTVATDLKDLSVTDSNRQALSEIRDFCLDNGIELIVIVLPYPNHFSIYRKDEYLATDQDLMELFCSPTSRDNSSARDVSGRCNICFYDFNLILAKYYDDSSNDLYADVGHMNTKGAEQFSAFFGRFLNLQDNGDDLSYMFRCQPLY